MLRRKISLLASALALTLFSTVQTARALSLDVANLYTARLSNLKGNINCRVGDLDCNLCTPNVRSTFATFKNAGGRDYDYGFDLTRSYAPGGFTPPEFLTITPTKGGGHLQTLARIPLEGTGTTRTWFAATYGKGELGSSVVYLVSMPTNTAGTLSGDGRLEYVFRAPGDHPGGSQAVGTTLVVSHDELSNGGYFEAYDFTSLGSSPTAAVRMPTLGNKRMAAVAATKLAGGGLLVLGKQAGDDEKSYDLYYAHTVRNGVPGWQYIGKGAGSEQIENVSLVTECGTGDLYAVTATGTDALIDNKWKLYRLSLAATGPALTLIDNVSKQAGKDCDARASGTAFVSRGGALHFYCSQKVATEATVGISDCLLGAILPGHGFEFGCLNSLVMERSMTVREY